ncbi:unnamed protein product [Closterium sp. NIES-64]|nr:unnamed protein product [Closterium sp. NIES-64]
MDCHDQRVQRTYSRRERSPSRRRRSRERGRSPTRSLRRAAYRADPVTPTDVRREESEKDLRVRSEPWRRPTISNPWNLAEGQRGTGGRRDNADDDGLPTARGGGGRENADDNRSPTARGGGRREDADDDGSPTARGGGRRANADDEGSPTVRGGGRHENADDDGSPTARDDEKRENADDVGSPTARAGGRRENADDDGSPTARGGGKHRPLGGGGGRRDAADEEEFPTTRGGGKRDIANDEQAFPVAREGGGQRKREREHQRVSTARLSRDPDMTADGAWRWVKVGGPSGNSGKRGWTMRSDVSRARLSGSRYATEKDEKGEGDHRSAPEQKEEVGSGGSKSGIARNVHLCGEMDVGRIRKGAGDSARTPRGKVRVPVALGGYGSMEKDRVGPGQLVRDWSEHCTGQAQEAEEIKESSEGLL